ncbi:MAG: preprotein translocase subunit SecE [Oscillospiraceae bacterium]
MSKDLDVTPKTEKVKTDKKEKIGFWKRTARHIKDLRGEFKKIVWPTKKQTLNNTGVVLAFTGVVAVCLCIVDFLLTYLMKTIF